jgi:L-ascorbate metabolism protein UlaG (beta-lactamase superfamily)
MAEKQPLQITWLGHATVQVITPAGTSIIIDPWLEGNPAHPRNFKPIEKIDLMLLTHGHGDHIGGALDLAQKHKPEVVGIFELCGLLGGQGMENTVGMNIGGTHRFKDVTVHMTEARHSSSVEHEGKFLYAGDAAGFVIEIEGAPTIYHSGDTALFSDMKIIGEFLKPKVAILPIGDHYTMGPRQAAAAAEWLGADVILPIHFGTFPALTGTPEELRKQLSARGAKAEVITWKPGEKYTA